MLSDGKQLRNASVALAKLAADVTTLLSGFVKADGTVPLTGPLDAGGQKLTNLGAPTVDTDAARLADILAIPWKEKVAAATTGNITLSGLQSIDGVGPVTANTRVLVRSQTTPAQNGIYLAASGPWTRAADADSASELRGAVVSVEQGTVNGDKRFAQTADNITLGTTDIVWVNIGSGGPAYETTDNKNMTASVTTADNQSACATAIFSTPAGDGYVQVMVNGIQQVLGDGIKTRDCYFSSDGGTTARTIANITAGDTLYWNGSVAGYQLATTDFIDFNYGV